TRTHFGYKDGIGVPLIEGSGSTGYPGQGPAINAGEFILGYPDETGNLPAMPQPEILGRNGTYLGFRKLHSRVAAIRQYLQATGLVREEGYRPSHGVDIQHKYEVTWREGLRKAYRSVTSMARIGQSPATRQ